MSRLVDHVARHRPRGEFSRCAELMIILTLSEHVKLTPDLPQFLQVSLRISRGGQQNLLYMKCILRAGCGRPSGHHCVRPVRSPAACA